jgi:hypothetical protein
MIAIEEMINELESRRLEFNRTIDKAIAALNETLYVACYAPNRIQDGEITHVSIPPKNERNSESVQIHLFGNDRSIVTINKGSLPDRALTLLRMTGKEMHVSAIEKEISNEGIFVDKANLVSALERAKKRLLVKRTAPATYKWCGLSAENGEEHMDK